MFFSNETKSKLLWFHLAKVKVLTTVYSQANRTRAQLHEHLHSGTQEKKYLLLDALFQNQWNKISIFNSREILKLKTWWEGGKQKKDLILMFRAKGKVTTEC